MNQNELISIIIPVYNVESYLSRCLDSVLNQTYRKLEVILVDDGSTDDSLLICSDYASKDDRIKVFHQENAGVSAARNKGIELSSGTYLGFVDADDWIEQDMYEVLMNAICTYGVPMSVINYVKDTEKNVHNAKGTKIVSLFTGKETFVEMISDGVIGGHMCTKLIKKDLFEGLTSPTDVTIFEDMMICSDLFERCEQVAYIDYHCYHYFIRPISATHSFNESHWSGEIADKYLLNKAKIICPEEIHVMDALCIDHNMFRAVMLSKDKNLTKDNYKRIENNLEDCASEASVSTLILGTRIKYRVFKFGRTAFNVWVSMLIVRRKIRGMIKDTFKL